MSEEQKKQECPFCHGVANVIEEGPGYPNWIYRVYCHKCGLTSAFSRNEVGAIQNWNRIVITSV